MSWACDQALVSNIANSYHAAGPLFAQTLQTFLAAQCALTGDHLWPDDATSDVLEDPNYDFIVVGAGSAGAVVANRLSENPDWKVLLVEAGGNPTLATEIPQLFPSIMGTELDWAYQTEPQEGICRAYKNMRCFWPRGKVLGGSSSINFMAYVRGNKADYDQWAANGNYQWSYEDVLPYFMKSENFSGDITDEHRKYHGQNGPLNVFPGKLANPFESMIVQAATELGLRNISDPNCDNQMGILIGHTNIKDYHRVSTARAFLSTAKERRNLNVIKNAYATKILFKSQTNRVSGILINKDGKKITVNVKKEVILSGGSINSPQLMMLSGLGPEERLKEMNIELKADLPVGENLEDHVCVPIFYTMPGDKEVTSLPNFIEAFVKYMLEGTGPLQTTSPHRVVAFINTTDPSASVPDFQFHYLVLPPGASNTNDFFATHGLNEEFVQKFNKINEDNFVIIVFNVLLRPKSSGKIVLASKNPFDKPLIYANYFKEPEDMEVMIDAIKQHSLKLGDTDTFKNAGFKLHWIELEACDVFEKASDEHLECIARELTFSLYHPTSTVKMGPDSDPTSVVDPELRVRKVKGLRVIDASIMPFVLRGNTNAPTIMIGEKGADMVKAFWLNKGHTEL